MAKQEKKNADTLLARYLYIYEFQRNQVSLNRDFLVIGAFTPSMLCLGAQLETRIVYDEHVIRAWLGLYLTRPEGRQMRCVSVAAVVASRVAPMQQRHGSGRAIQVLTIYDPPKPEKKCEK